ncbi:cytochrome c biogenesis CcdA family protein [Effusibacillus pohliae]|uniref:cytochrome c biogenesis CcdA family protein n=1 Tax=Effusibacillus pohliae TaxID=232270 RepID=UPI0003618CD5|nr:cytochrome c biogenesis CcdA family protein [Effusibacillus pohliae]
MPSLNLGIVFSAGAAAAFNPCGVALLPAFVAYLMGGQEARWSKGVQAGVMMTLGFLSVFLPLGLLTAAFKGIFAQYLSVVIVLVGFFLVLAGFAMFSGRKLLNIKSFQVKKGRNRAKSFYLYGIAYAITSLGCTLPIFSLLVVSALTAGGLFDGMVKFLAYGIGMGIVVTLISVAAVVSRQLVQSFIHNVTPVLNKLSAVLLIASGIYLMMKYWTF